MRLLADGHCSFSLHKSLRSELVLVAMMKPDFEEIDRMGHDWMDGYLAKPGS
jgi:hypothetical protein